MKKRVTDTSRAARAEIAVLRATREHEVCDALQQFARHHGFEPTAYELLRWMQIANTSIDLNGVRPRLTELRNAGRVRTGEKRLCAVTGKRVYVWSVVTPRPLPPSAPLSAAAQEALF